MAKLAIQRDFIVSKRELAGIIKEGRRRKHCIKAEQYYSDEKGSR